MRWEVSDLPIGWVDGKIGDLFEFIYGKSLPDRVRSGEGYSVYGSNGIVGYHSEPLTKGETIIIGRKGSVGEVHYSPTRCFPIDTTYYVEQFQDMPAKFWFYLLKSSNLGRLNKATAIPGLNRNDAYDVDIWVPPLNEQKRIAEKLDSLLARVDSCQSHLERVPQILKRFRQSVLAAAVKGRLSDNATSNGRDLPNGWRWIKLSEITSQVKDADHKMPKPAISDIPYISTKDFVGYDEIDFENSKHISEEDYTNLTRKIKPVIGDILLSRYGTVGEVRKVTTNRRFQASYSIAIIKPLPNIVLTDFLIAVLRSSIGQDQMRQNIRASSQPDLGLENIRKFDIPLPPLEEQAEIVQRANKILEDAGRLESHYQSAVARVEQLTPSLLAKALRGELVEQDPDDEPASLLLERIRASRENPTLDVQIFDRVRLTEQIRIRKDQTMPKRTEVQPNYLSSILTERGTMTAEALWAASQLDIDDFYDQLKDEEANNLLREVRGDNENSPRLLEAV
jgi:type I restriction enzyme, S subunit